MRKKSWWGLSHQLFFLLHLLFYFLPKCLPASLYWLNRCDSLLIILR
jgi:hypothetical protein